VSIATPGPLSALPVMCMVLGAVLTTTTVADARPTGALTRISGATFIGWACDADVPAVPVAVNFYANGEGTRGPQQSPVPAWGRYKGSNLKPDHFVGSALADEQSSPPDSHEVAACGNGKYAFSFTVPRAFRSGLGPGTHNIYAFAQMSTGQGPNPELRGSPSPLLVQGARRTVDDWFGNLNHACHLWKDKTWPDRTPDVQDSAPAFRLAPPSPGACTNDYPAGFVIGRDRAWVLESTNETRDFAPLRDGPGTSIDFAPNAPSPHGNEPAWQFATLKSPRGGYTVKQVLDKKSGGASGTPLDSYSAAFMETELSPRSPDLGSAAVFLELWWRVGGADGAPILQADASAGLTRKPYSAIAAQGMLPARYRFAVGLNIRGTSSPLLRTIEVNLLKSGADTEHRPPHTASFDLCDSGTSVEATRPPVPCEQADRYGPFQADDIDLFDRRSVANPIVYFNGATLHRVTGLPQPSRSEDGFQRVLISVVGLLRNAPWLDRPGMAAALPLKDGLADLTGLRLKSFYIGSEIWGKARLAVEFERLSLFIFEAE